MDTPSVLHRPTISVRSLLRKYVLDVNQPHLARSFLGKAMKRLPVDDRLPHFGLKTLWSLQL